MKISTARADSCKELSGFSAHNCDIFMINFYREINFASYYEIPQPIKIVKALSAETGTVITLCSNIRIEDEIYYSVVIFDKGILLGISDSITTDVNQGKCQKIYTTSCGNFGVCVGKDFLCPQVENCFCVGANFILHQTLDKLGCEYMCAIKGHAVFGTHFVGLYDDIVIKSDGRIESLDIGNTIELNKSNEIIKPSTAFLKINCIE